MRDTLTGEVSCVIIYSNGGDSVSITADLIRGHTDTIILAALMSEDSYGYRINKAIRMQTDNEYELKEATLYTAFHRLEEAGCITSYWGNEESGARRRYYAITGEGRSAYRAMMREWQEASGLLEKLMRFGDEDTSDDTGNTEQI